MRCNSSTGAACTRAAERLHVRTSVAQMDDCTFVGVALSTDHRAYMWHGDYGEKEIRPCALGLENRSSTGARKGISHASLTKKCDEKKCIGSNEGKGTGRSILPFRH